MMIPTDYLEQHTQLNNKTMKNRFETAINKLVKAFFDGTLAKGDCTKCAVGNICDNKGDWSKVFMTTGYGSDVNPELYINNVLIKSVLGIYLVLNPKDTIDKTGYSWEELALVESAFESNTKIHATKYYKHTEKELMQDQYNGLMAVVDVLCEIEGIEATETKKLFEYV